MLKMKPNALKHVHAHYVVKILGVVCSLLKAFQVNE